VEASRNLQARVQIHVKHFGLTRLQFVHGRPRMTPSTPHVLQHAPLLSHHFFMNAVAWDSMNHDVHARTDR